MSKGLKHSKWVSFRVSEEVYETINKMTEEMGERLSMPISVAYMTRLLVDTGLEHLER